MNLDLSFDFDFSDFSGAAKIEEPTRYIKPPVRRIAEKNILYEYAKDFVQGVGLPAKDERIFCRVSGNFILGDAIEAFCVENNLHVKRMVIETLSISQENIDSLQNLITGGYVEKLDLVISDYFYSHERHDLIPYIYEQLDIDNKFQLAVIGTHCKICLIETFEGAFYVIHGSGNLRSSNNIEQIVIEESKDLFDFNIETLDAVIEKYKTINKSLRGGKLWQVVQKASQK